MPETIERVVVKRAAGMTLSSIIWRRFKRPMPGHAERVLARNPGLAALGPILPLNTAFDLIVPSAEDLNGKPVPVLRLWGTAE